MTDFEEQVRRALRSDVADVGAEQLLVDVHRGVHRRRRRRAVAVVTASILVMAGAVGVVTQLSGGDVTPAPPITQSPSPSPAPTEPHPPRRTCLPARPAA